MNFQLCVALWQSVKQDILEILIFCKTCSSWKKMHDIFVNDIQRLSDATQ